MLSSSDSSKIQISLMGAVKDVFPLQFDSSSSCIAYLQKNKSDPKSTISTLHNDILFQSRAHLYIKTQGNILPVENVKTLGNQIHASPITCIKLGSKRPPIMISSSKDALVSWTLDPDSSYSTPKVVANGLGHVSSISIQSSQEWIACCVDTRIFAFNLESNRKVCFEGHDAAVKSCEFFIPHPFAPPECKNWCISISEDRTFKVWDIYSLSCLFQSSIISSSPFTCIAIDPLKFCCSMGTDDGVVRIWDLTPKGNLKCEPRLLKTLDMEQYFSASPTQIEIKQDIDIVTSIPKWKQDPKPLAIPLTETIEHSRSIVSVTYLNQFTSDNSRNPKGRFGNLICVGRVTDLILIHADSFDVVFTHNFLSMSIEMDVLGDVSSKSYLLQGVTRYSFSAVDGLPNCVRIMIGNGLSGEVFILLIHLNRSLKNNLHSRKVLVDSSIDDSNSSLLEVIQGLIAKRVKGDNWVLNILGDCLDSLAEIGIDDIKGMESFDGEFPNNLPVYIKEYFESKRDQPDSVRFASLKLFDDGSSIIPPNSILSSKPSVTKEKFKSSKIGKGASAGRIGSTDQPVTFRRTVKSSGYSNSPEVVTMFTKPRLKSLKSLTSPKKRESTYANINVSYENLINPAPFGMLSHSSTINSIQFHPSGAFLASCSMDRIARFYKTPLGSKSTCRDFSGHDAAVTQVSWGLDPIKAYGNLLLTSCRDGRARIWSTERSEPLLIFSHLKGTPPSSIATSPKPILFRGDVKDARFFYLDKFVLIPYQDSILTYTYSLEPLSSTLIKPQLNYNKYKLVKTLKNIGKTITAFQCINSKKSNIIFAASSDKCLNIWDIITGTITRQIQNAQTRPIHDISLPEFSSSQSHIFVTGAVTDSIRLWDLRLEGSVMHLQGHVNRHALVRSSISPCGNYIGVGSEDQHAYIYDIRMRLCCAKTCGNHGDVVTCVAYHPLKGQMVTGGYDGKMRLFSG